jgi:hypothetical protein
MERGGATKMAQQNFTLYDEKGGPCKAIKITTILTAPIVETGQNHHFGESVDYQLADGRWLNKLNESEFGTSDGHRFSLKKPANR